MSKFVLMIGATFVGVFAGHFIVNAAFAAMRGMISI
jgi:hypothetical protein